MLVTEKTGRLRRISQAGEVSDAISGVPAVNNRSQGGLLDVNIAPDFETSRWVYLCYAESRSGNKTGTTLARGKLNSQSTALENVSVLFRQEPAWSSNLHYGCRIVWDSNQYLFLTLGERSKADARVFAQDTNTHLGKVIRLNADGSVPDSNPFFNGGGAKEVWSYGHRNPQGAFIHPVTDQLWTIEHGPKGGDELNKPEAGKNYGWPTITYGEEYSGSPVGSDITQKDGMEQPIYYWDPVIAPCGMAYYDDSLFPSWRGNIFIAGLGVEHLVRLQMHEGQVVGEERLLNNIGRIRDVEVGPNGALWLALSKGEIVKIGK